jgi:hypothetical protein
LFKIYEFGYKKTFFGKFSQKINIYQINYLLGLPVSVGGIVVLLNFLFCCYKKRFIKNVFFVKLESKWYGEINSKKYSYNYHLMVFYSQNRKTTTECYVLLITCMHTQAVHLEVCPNINISAVARALTRFACLKGDPEVIFSDKQTSLLLARHEYLQQRPEGFEWKNITPRAPNQGCRWKRMVPAMKRAIRSLAKSDLLDEEEFRTLLATAAELLNSRPIV